MPPKCQCDCPSISVNVNNITIAGKESFVSLLSHMLAMFSVISVVRFELMITDRLTELKYQCGFLCHDNSVSGCINCKCKQFHAGCMDTQIIIKLWKCLLTHWGWDKMAAISQTTLSNAFSWMKILEFRFRFHWSLFPRVQHWFR